MEGNREFALSEGPSGSDGDGNWVGGPGLVRSLWRYRFVIALVTVLGALGGFAVALLLPARYEAQANLYLRDPSMASVLSVDWTGQTRTGDHAVFMAAQSGLAGSDLVLGRALQYLKRSGTPEELRQSVVVAASADLASLTVSATASDPVEAADLANAVGAAYEQVARERIAADSKAALVGLQQVMGQRQAEFDALQAQVAQATGVEQANLGRKAQHVAELIGLLQVHQDEIAGQAAVYGSGVDSFQLAVPPVSSSQPAPVLLALIGAVIGLVGSGMWAWWAAGRDRRVEEEGDAAEILGVPLLGETPRLGATLQGTDGPSELPATLDPVAAEAYHVVLASLEHALARVGGKVVAVASAGAGDGKTVTVLNLALAAQREGRKVLLVDADERTRRLSQLCRDGEYFEVTSTSHVTDERPAFTTGGTVLQIGPSDRNGHHPAVFFRSTTFASMISHWGEQADLVIVDTPALLAVSESVTVADHADAILMVVSRGASLADLRRARERLAFTDTPLIGYVLNRGSAQRAYAANGRLRHWRPAKLPQLARRG